MEVSKADLKRSSDVFINGIGVTLVETVDQPLGVSLVNSRKSTKTATSGDLVELAQVVQRGDEGVHSAACNKLSVIADQIRYLQEQAKQVLEKAKRDSDLHHAACNIVKKPGSIYYLYERDSGQKYLSIISPQEWGSAAPRKYHGGYRLEVDRTWTPIDEVPAKDKEQGMLNSVLQLKEGIVRAAINFAPHDHPN
ncbi:C1orf50 [Bugula neritina]|uniref:C1orf50 n=1 Tax=Bugula neritina TaxID=10212 RepID=A0A7J7JFZ7_BUGNE|nr:C1orf50 [Bugula neritina]